MLWIPLILFGDPHDSLAVPTRNGYHIVTTDIIRLVEFTVAGTPGRGANTKWTVISL
jgi:hypothetical protein